MNETQINEIIKKASKNSGAEMHSGNWDILISFDEINLYDINFTVTKHEKDKNGYPIKFTNEDLKDLIQDLEDLSDWRHYRRLKNKLHSLE